MLTLFGFQLLCILQMSFVSPSKRVAVILHGRLFYIAGNDSYKYSSRSHYRPRKVRKVSFRPCPYPKNHGGYWIYSLLGAGQYSQLLNFINCQSCIFVNNCNGNTIFFHIFCNLTFLFISFIFPNLILRINFHRPSHACTIM